jgi:hypothetical protein
VATSEPVVFTTGEREALQVATRCGRLLQRLCWAALVTRARGIARVFLDSIGLNAHP